MRYTKSIAAMGSVAALSTAALGLAAPASAATVTAAHVDIVSVTCTPNAAHTKGTLKLGSNVEIGSTETFYPAAQASANTYKYAVNSSTAPYLSWVPTSGSAGYYNASNSEAEETVMPFVGFAYDEEDECAGITLPPITITLTKAAGTNRIWAHPAAGVLDTNASPATSITLTQHAHQHTVWRFYAPSRTAQTYKPVFTVSGAISGTVSPTITVG